jgi:peptidoglycan/LPS O-acetylase OafA/YrhL
VEVIRKDIIADRNKSSLLEAAGFICGFIILLTVPFYFELITGRVVDFHGSIFYFFYALLWGGILIAAKYGTGYLIAIFELNIFRFIGVISYSMYLFHQPILTVVNSNFLSLPQGLRIYVFIFITVLGSSVSYLLIEKPLSKIRLSRKSSGDQKESSKIENLFPYFLQN